VSIIVAVAVRVADKAVYPARTSVAKRKQPVEKLPDTRLEAFQGLDLPEFAEKSCSDLGVETDLTVVAAASLPFFNRLEGLCDRRGKRNRPGVQSGRFRSGRGGEES
jgi:hypothetical protein